MSRVSREESLCCCEYARASDGETRHLLQFLCECDAFDQLADDALSSCCSMLCCGCCDEPPPPHAKPPDPRTRQAVRRQLLRRVCKTGADRFRVPWPGGARTVNAGAVAAPLVLWALRVVSGLSHGCAWPLAWLILAGAGLVWWHIMSLRIRWRTRAMLCGSPPHSVSIMCA